jgi:hypothetical protein
VINIHPSKVRLQPAIEDGYEWKPVSKKENPFRKELFPKQMSKHSIKAYMELCRGVGNSFEAVPSSNTGNMLYSEPEGEPAGVSMPVIGLVLRRHKLMSWIVRKHLRIEIHPLFKNQFFTTGKRKAHPRT